MEMERIFLLDATPKVKRTIRPWRRFSSKDGLAIHRMIANGFAFVRRNFPSVPIHQTVTFHLRYRILSIKRVRYRFQRRQESRNVLQGAKAGQVRSRNKGSVPNKDLPVVFIATMTFTTKIVGLVRRFTSILLNLPKPTSVIM